MSSEIRKWSTNFELLSWASNVEMCDCCLTSGTSLTKGLSGHKMQMKMLNGMVVTNLDQPLTKWMKQHIALLAKLHNADHILKQF